jgi:surfactin synthase thioesterase subunit
MLRSSLSNDWIVIPRPALSPSVRLLCFPHGGGSATAFNEWPGNLPEDVEVCVVQLPGRGRRMFEPSLNGVNQVIEALLEEFQPFQETPLALFGHSLGAWLAFEFCRQLQLRKIPLVHLFVSGQIAPQLPDPEAPIRHLSDREFISEVRRRYDGLPEEILRDDEMMTLLLPALRADFTMKETYRYVEGPLLECSVSSFGGHEDCGTSIDELTAWRNQTSLGFSLRMFPGGHFFIDSARKSVLKFVVEDLERSLRGLFNESKDRVGE